MTNLNFICHDFAYIFGQHYQFNSEQSTTHQYIFTNRTQQLTHSSKHIVTYHQPHPEETVYFKNDLTSIITVKQAQTVHWTQCQWFSFIWVCKWYVQYGCDDTWSAGCDLLVCAVFTLSLIFLQGKGANYAPESSGSEHVSYTSQLHNKATPTHCAMICIQPRVSN